MRHDDLPYRAMRELAVVVTKEINAKLAERDRRIDQIEALVKRHDKLDRIIADPMNDYALECMRTGEDRDWEFAEQVEESVPVVQELKKKWTRSTH